MMNYLQRIGRSIMLPVAVLPAAAILMGIGNWIEGTVWGEGNIAAVCLINAGGSIIDHVPILFAVGIALGMSKDRDGSAALAGWVGFLVVTTLLSTATVALLQGVDAGAIRAPFGNMAHTSSGY